MPSKRRKAILAAAIAVVLTVALCLFWVWKHNKANDGTDRTRGSRSVAASSETGEADPIGSLRTATEDEKLYTNLDLKLRVRLFDAEEAYTDVQKLPDGEKNAYVLFLPADCDRSRLRVTFEAKTLSLDKKPIASGETTAAFAEDKTVTAKTDTGTYTIRVCSSAHLPAVFLTTESGSLRAIHAEKTYREKASLTLTDGGKTVLAGSKLSHIKGRGNRSWDYNEKRSYNIKFTKKTGILGMAAAKKWALISDNMDPSLMRNAIAYTAAQLTSLPYTVDFRFVDLYINGNYRGNYLLCEKIEVAQNRIAIRDLEKANEAVNAGVDLEKTDCLQQEIDGMQLKWWDLPKEPKDVSGGYLLEFDDKGKFETEASAFFSQRGFCLHIHTPEHISQKEILYLSALYNEFEQALYAPDGKNAKGKSYLNYIDADSFVDAAILYEFASEQDFGKLSLHIFLPEGSTRFVMGPIWDFDMSMHDPDAQPESVNMHALLRAEERTGEHFEDKRRWNSSIILQLLCMPEFIDRTAARAQTLCDVFRTQLNDEVSKLFDTIVSSAACDALRWSYTETDTQLRSFVPARADALERYFSDFDASVEAKSQKIIENEP